MKCLGGGLAIGVSAMLSLVLASCSNDSDADPSSAAAATPSAKGASPVGDTRLPEGTYRTAEVTLDDLTATALAAGIERALIDAHFDPINDASSIMYTLKLDSGRWTQFASVDGAPPEIGWAGRYEVIDDTTVVATDQCGAITYDYSLVGGSLSLQMVADECLTGEPAGDAGELIAQTTIYGTAPFVKIR